MLSDKELEHIAALARIELKPEEKEKLKKDLGSILDYIDKLDKADTSSVEPLYQTSGLINAEREDEPRNSFKSENVESLLIGQAPDKQERFVKVKPVMKKK
ncbi:MAG TPA: Asp-tRNA(Asn)/Glu-tRNA(Gln) amidotransferase subunit GatC [Candidatus Paceibacterota bacterium]|nr:Asp-tRNA(Asn)/Glu-tRNA(Gln) amidotransferase subunit GatC [Candidatus Paceibacterota bacterium]